MRLNRKFLTLGLFAAAGIILLKSPALASSGGNLPWEGPLEQIQKSITGPVAGYIALAAVAIAGGMLIFGGELNDFARRLMYIVLVAGILLGATTIVGLFGATGASIGLAKEQVNTGVSGSGVEGAHE
ncbi:TrbC/VirB2 family protein [Rhizobium mesoamericanum]|uniref:TrbC/VirB2 family protein n=1 Tax=Rhizobium mesoamericanum TaxID=1079800 RepID=UPI0003F81BD2|nr:TrbC/VirB2 family protein [Rhizobium mesoamericanum]